MGENVNDVRGHLDGVVGRLAFGWALDDSDPSRKLKITIVDKQTGVTLGEGLANQPREDLGILGQQDSDYAFRIELNSFPSSLAEIEAVAGGVTLVKASTSTAAPSSGNLSSRSLDVLASLNQANLALQRTLALEIKVKRIAAALGLPLDIDNELPDDQKHQPRETPRQKAEEPGKLIVFSIIDWGYRYQRPQQISASLAEDGYQIYYVNANFIATHSSGSDSKALLPSLKRVRKNILEVTLKKPPHFSGSGNEQDLNNIYNHPSDAMALWISAQLRSLIEIYKLESAIAIIMHPSWHKICRTGLQELPIVYDCMDHIAGFPETSIEVIEEEKLLASKCDALVTTSEFLYSQFTHNNHYLIRNGCEYAYFSAAAMPDSLFERYQSATSPIVCYYGAISGWFDLKLVADVANQLNHHTFLLAGSTEGCDLDAVEIPDNVHFLGEIPYNKLTALLLLADVCIIPFKLIDLIKATNPVKVYEYLAAGKPVVSTWLPEIEALNLDESLVRLAATADEFSAAIINATQEDSSHEIVAARQHFAAENTWNNRKELYDKALNSIFPEVSIIIPCHNNIHSTQLCIESLQAHTHYPNYKLIVVDDASKDGTHHYLNRLQEQNSQISVITLEENSGFAHACNRGMGQARSDYLVILNNDTQVTPHWLFKLLRALRADQSIGLCGPVTNAIGNEQKIKIAYGSMKEMQWRSQEFTTARHRKTLEVDALAFFCVMLKRDVVRDIGLLDEDFGLGYYEDDDYCVRARKAGYRLLICDDVFIHHELSKSFGKDDLKRSELIAKNRTLFCAKWGFDVAHSYRDEEGFG
ncbi:glycosyltransferase [Synechococcus sp. CBW1107]|uniref:glycosyltransferase n=1 Tax=Synechococcus sp. CBW1107 TaxID=2789857 RepID=UPI002AD4935E|nr:glycosyltransferase [Synechococcus sp. CBW1107]CAK6690956.1 Undecaprenyl-phosphate 4-deoxy-4-formamido-L-arabinose transferase [Synechococcus sp. CBW1107]